MTCLCSHGISRHCPTCASRHCMEDCYCQELFETGRVEMGI